MNVDQNGIQQTAEAIQNDADRIRKIMENMTPEERATALASDEAKKAEVRAKSLNGSGMDILGVSPQQKTEQEGRHI